jgi:hypothetical protein
VDRVSGIFQIRELSRACRTYFTARRSQALADAVIAEGAFVGDMLGGMEIAAPVWTCLNAIPAADTVVLIHEDHAVRGVKCGAHRTDLCARGVGAVVAELRNKKRFSGAIGRSRESVFAAIW